MNICWRSFRWRCCMSSLEMFAEFFLWGLVPGCPSAQVFSWPPVSWWWCRWCCYCCYAWLLHLISDKAPPAARDSCEVAHTPSRVGVWLAANVQNWKPVTRGGIRIKIKNYWMGRLRLPLQPSSGSLHLWRYSLLADTRLEPLPSSPGTVLSCLTSTYFHCIKVATSQHCRQ